MAESRIDELRRRLERDPGSRLFAQLAEEHRKAGELAEAIRVARAGLGVHPVYPSARLTLGRALLTTGDAAGARQELELALRQAPDNILACRYLAEALEQLGDAPSALRQFKAALALSPGDRQLAAHVEQLEAGAETSGRPGPTGPMPRAVPPVPREMPPTAATLGPATLPPMPAGARGDAVGGPERPVPTVRLSGVPPLPQAARTVAVPGEARTASFVAEGGAPSAGPATAGAVRAETAGGRPPADTDAASAGPSAGPGDAPPFSSSTLAELYLRQGLRDKAVEVYRQLLAEDPGNERARSRLATLEGREGMPQDGGTEARRHVLERTIAGLEAMLAGLRRR